MLSITMLADMARLIPQEYPLCKAELVIELKFEAADSNLMADFSVSIYEQLKISTLSMMVVPDRIVITPS